MKAQSDLSAEKVLSLAAHSTDAASLGSDLQETR
jgi:hypothetical protein